jgi:hypothetical protein
LEHIAYGEDRAITKLTLMLAATEGYRISYDPTPSVALRLHPLNITNTIPFGEQSSDRQSVRTVYYPESTDKVWKTNISRFFWRQTYRKLNQSILRPINFRLRGVRLDHLDV